MKRNQGDLGQRTCRASHWLVLTVVVGCDGSTSTSDFGIVADVAGVCDGSSEINLSFTSVSGTPGTTYDAVMTRHGTRFLAINGTCTFYAFDGHSDPLGVWTPVATGVLSDASLTAVASELNVDLWANSDHAFLSTENPIVDATTNAFYVNGHYADCYSCNEVGQRLAESAMAVIDDLYAEGESYVSDEIDVLVFETVAVLADGWWLEWGSARSIDEFLRSRDGPPSNMGVVVSGSDAEWFLQSKRDFQERDLAVFPRQQEGVYVFDPAQYELFLGTVVPGMPELWAGYSNAANP